MMLYLLDWANLLLRWAHVIVAIAWIGSSFYFVFLDSSLTRPTAPDLKARGVDGELWAVHGGGFYNPQKYLVAPQSLPEHLHWFYWESYSTWLTGFGLLTVLYLFNASTFLVDRNVLDWSAPAAIGAVLALLAGFWLAYDRVCRTLGQGPQGERRVAVAVLMLVVAASWGATQLFAGRAAFLLVGAMLATAMSANVFFWIIPGQRTVIAQMKAGEPVDPIHGQRAKQRSVHNTYFTLPVLIAMLSNHYGWLYQGQVQGQYAWAVLVVLMLAGALIRHSFVARHKARVEGRAAPWGYAIAGTLLLLALAAALAPGATPQSAATPVRFAEVQRVIEQRCVPCHNAGLANKGVALDSPEGIRRHAAALMQQAVLQRLMPLNNATGISEAERDLLRRWFEAGAATTP